MQENKFINQKIVAIDYGRRRIGLASCDMYHITITPRFTVDINTEDKFTKIADFINKEEIRFVVIGIPERDDDKNKEFIDEIKIFAMKLKEITSVDIIEYDESFSTREATGTMINIGYRKKKRAEKSRKDMIAAAVILRNFLTMVDN